MQSEIDAPRHPERAAGESKDLICNLQSLSPPRHHSEEQIDAAASTSPFKIRYSTFDFLPTMRALWACHSEPAEESIEPPVPPVIPTERSEWRNLFQQSHPQHLTISLNNFPGKYLTNKLKPGNLNLTDAVLN
jgi:hypothetical protein